MKKNTLRKNIEWLFWLALGMLGVYLFSFVLFAEGRREDAEKSLRTPQADGIVVLTGSSRRRIEQGLMLMADKRGRRVLITGVHKNVTMDTILDMSLVESDKIACCVDLDYRATNTVGNAAEAALWARIHGYRSVILVTSTHHVPRTLLEMQRTMPNIRLIAHPVNPPGIRLDAWWKYPGTFTLLIGEFTRYLFALFDMAGAHDT